MLLSKSQFTRIQVILIILIYCITSTVVQAADGPFQSSNFVPRFDIQIGSQWTRHPASLRHFRYKVVENEKTQIKQLSTEENLLQSTLQVESGTGFYLGKHGNTHIIATNNHVLSGSCFPPQDFMHSSGGVLIKMTLLNIDFECIRVVGSWYDVDLTLIAVKPLNKSDEEKLQNVGLKLSAYPAEYNERLITAGYGIKDNSRLSYDISRNCRVFSDTEWVKYLRDPDTHSPSNGKVWSLAHGCNISHGDSGSALMSLETGRVIGVNWTVGRLPRSPEMYNDHFLDEIDILDSKIWTELNYGASSCAIIKQLKSAVNYHPISYSSNKNFISGKRESNFVKMGAMTEKEQNNEIINSIIQASEELIYENENNYL